MASNELVPVNAALLRPNDRRAALARLNAAAEAVDSIEDATVLMEQARVIGEALRRTKQPFDDTREAGKACVTTARKLGGMLASLSTAQPPVQIIRSEGGKPRFATGRPPSERYLVAAENGMNKSLVRTLVRLADAADPDFQRYIQDSEIIPSINGALRACRPEPRLDHNGLGRKEQRLRRQKKIGVKHPREPSLDEGYSLIVRALGHLSGYAGLGHPERRRDIARAIDYLYAAEDIVKPYRGGYTDRRSA